MVIITNKFKKNKSHEINYQAGAISDTNIIVGNMLNRPFEEYYTFAFSSKSNLVGYYDTIMSKYKSEKESLKVYYIDTEDYFNNKYVEEVIIIIMIMSLNRKPFVSFICSSFTIKHLITFFYGLKEKKSAKIC